MLLLFIIVILDALIVMLSSILIDVTSARTLFDQVREVRLLNAFVLIINRKLSMLEFCLYGLNCLGVQYCVNYFNY